jgi:hypothetical protein
MFPTNHYQSSIRKKGQARDGIVGVAYFVLSSLYHCELPELERCCRAGKSAKVDGTADNPDYHTTDDPDYATANYTEYNARFHRYGGRPSNVSRPL